MSVTFCKMTRWHVAASRCELCLTAASDTILAGISHRDKFLKWHLLFFEICYSFHFTLVPRVIQAPSYNWLFWRKDFLIKDVRWPCCEQESWTRWPPKVFSAYIIHQFSVMASSVQVLPLCRLCMNH